jgi:hypothetical protein
MTDYPRDFLKIPICQADVTSNRKPRADSTLNHPLSVRPSLPRPFKLSPQPLAQGAVPMAAPLAVRPRPALFRALGADDPPVEIEVGGRPYRRAEILKHDSWAATALFEGPAGRVVCKFNRRQSLLGVPMAWLGRALARHEARLLALLADLPNVPNLCGPVRVAGRVLPNAVAHDYVPGHPLRRQEQVRADFFPKLRDLLGEMHRRRMAYVDLHKRENIIVGDDGEPYLIDFQISLALTHRWADATGPAHVLLRLLQRSDEYHLHKHISKVRPDQEGVIAAGLKKQVPWWIRAHRLIAVPFRELRRRLLVALGVRVGKGRAVSEQFAEDAVRREAA